MQWSLKSAAASSNDSGKSAIGLTGWVRVKENRAFQHFFAGVDLG